MATNWTEAKVREELPDVNVEIRGTYYLSQISGRINLFATVRPIGTDYEFQYAWSTLADILNRSGLLRPTGLG